MFCHAYRSSKRNSHQWIPSNIKLCTTIQQYVLTKERTRDVQWVLLQSVTALLTFCITTHYLTLMCVYSKPLHTYSTVKQRVLGPGWHELALCNLSKHKNSNVKYPKLLKWKYLVRAELGRKDLKIIFCGVWPFNDILCELALCYSHLKIGKVFPIFVWAKNVFQQGLCFQTAYHNYCVCIRL